ncbi:hypothetical protein H6F51_13865 [Cyanobacteria bacterium FACHB-DQ100]|uniref:glycosyltransferase n=1 Tax=Leptolyngbya sp. DQ-M1 TaxID=2933920 RepID=UPI0019C6B6CD|nr:hypothetical protein [Cyanobacteria bacterium FACHB-DQ100]
MIDPIRIFIGSSPKNTIEESVFRYTLLKQTQHPIEIYAIDGTSGSAKNLTTGEVKRLPAGVSDRIQGATAFSLARWAIPEWCNYQGRAIYCDSDQIALQDMTELWNYGLGDSSLAAVPVKQAKCYQHYIADSMGVFLHTEETFYLASVMLMDCEKIQWNLSELVELLDRNAFSLPNLMYLGEQFRQHFNLSVSALPSEWNHLDYADRESKIVHFTDLTSQPWRFHHNPIAEVWETVFLAAVDDNALTQAQLETAYANGWINRRIKVLAQLPSLVRRPINWVWRSWGATVFKVRTTLDRQVQRLKSGLFRLTQWKTIRA